MYESILDTPSGDFVIPLRQSFMKMLGEDPQAAALLSVLEHWTNHERRENRIRRRENRKAVQNGHAKPNEVNEKLWVRRTRSKIVQDSLGLLPHKRAVTSAASTLEDLGLIETGYPFRGQGVNTKHYRLRTDRINRELRSMSLPTQITDEEREQEISESSGEIQEGESEQSPSDVGQWSSGDWQRRYAVRWWDRMDSLGGGRISADWRKKKEDIIQRWADAFDWCVRVRGLDREDLNRVLEWLFEEDDFWVRKKAIVAPTKFKEKTDQGQWRIHQFMMKAQGTAEKKSDLPEEGEEVSAFDRTRLLSKHHELTEADFTSVRYAEDGRSKIYRYDP